MCMISISEWRPASVRHDMKPRVSGCKSYVTTLILGVTSTVGQTGNYPKSWPGGFGSDLTTDIKTLL